MLIVTIDEAEPGMRIALDVAHPENPEQELLKRGFVLDDVVLAKLRDLGVPSVFVDYPGLEDLDRHMGAHLSPARHAVYRQVRSAISTAEKSSKPLARFSEYAVAVRGLVTTLMEQGQHPLYMDLLAARPGSDAIGHATAVAHLSLALGLKLQSYLIDQRSRLNPKHAAEVVNLGVAGMLHDLGKTKLPDHLADFTDAAPPENGPDRDLWETHPSLGYELVKGGIEPSGAAAVLHHHQHFDGSGFPRLTLTDGSVRRPAGTAIHVFPRILLAADLYDRLAPAGEGRGRRPNILILHLLRERFGAWLDPQVLQALTAVVPPFPPGSKVCLDDGRVAVVIAINPEEPYFPVVKRLAPDGKSLELRSVNLATPGAPAVRSVGTLEVGAMLPKRGKGPSRFT